MTQLAKELVSCRCPESTGKGYLLHVNYWKSPAANGEIKSLCLSVSCSEIGVPSSYHLDIYKFRILPPVINMFKKSLISCAQPNQHHAFIPQVQRDNDIRFTKVTVMDSGIRL